MSTEIDRWGLDPSVQAMRRVFSMMEAAQTELLKRLEMSSFDKRLRPAQDSARNIFEHAWSLAVKRGIEIGENEVFALYTHCLAQALLMIGVEIPSSSLSDNKDISMLIREVLQ